MQRRTILNGALGLLSSQVGLGGQAEELVRVGWVTAQTPSSLAPYIAAFRAALAGLGYVEGQNLVIDFRYGNDSIDRVPELVADLERIPVNVIVAQGSAVSVISQLRPRNRWSMSSVGTRCRPALRTASRTRART